MTERAPLGRLALGATVLAGEKLRVFDKPVPDSIAVLVGVAERGRDTARDVLRRAGDKAKQMTPRPPRRLTEFIDDARARGGRTIRTGRLEARGWLTRTMDGSLRWAERTIVPRMVDDMTPHIVNNVLPRVIEGVMPQIRSRVVPIIVEDLSTDERIRKLVAERSHSIITEAAGELRDGTARADDRHDNPVHKLSKSKA